jgi:hypothetical protein
MTRRRNKRMSKVLKCDVCGVLFAERKILPRVIREVQAHPHNTSKVDVAEITVLYEVHWFGYEKDVCPVCLKKILQKVMEAL